MQWEVFGQLIFGTMKDLKTTIIEIILVGVFITCLNFIANAQLCDPTLVRAGRDTTFIIKDYTLLLLEPFTKEEYDVSIIFKKKTPTISIVNNTELTYIGIWEHPSGTWGTISHSSNVGSIAKYSFIGNRIEVFGTKASHHGLLGYTINSGTEKNVNLNSINRQDGVLLIDEPVPPGFNTITFRVISNTVLIDYLRITK